jgi:hypothetical protein
MRRNVASALMIFAALALTSCVSREQLAERAAAARAEIAYQDDVQCQSYGARPGSDAYVACRMNAANARQAQENIDAARRQEASEALIAAGASMMTNGR